MGRTFYFVFLHVLEASGSNGSKNKSFFNQNFGSGPRPDRALIYELNMNICISIIVTSSVLCETT